MQHERAKDLADLEVEVPVQKVEVQKLEKVEAKEPKMEAQEKDDIYLLNFCSY